MKSLHMRMRVGLAEVHAGVFAGGCFWSVQAVLQRIRGVTATLPGYIWLTAGIPGQESLERHDAERVEGVLVNWDPLVIPTRKLVEIFLSTSSPGLVRWEHLHELSKVRSALCLADDKDREAALEVIADWGREQEIHTQVLGGVYFEQASVSDSDFYRKHPQDGFCRSIIRPKLDKLQRRFPEQIREDR